MQKIIAELIHFNTRNKLIYYRLNNMNKNICIFIQFMIFLYKIRLLKSVLMHFGVIYSIIPKSEVYILLKELNNTFRTIMNILHRETVRINFIFILFLCKIILKLELMY